MEDTYELFVDPFESEQCVGCGSACSDTICDVCLSLMPQLTMQLVVLEDGD